MNTPHVTQCVSFLLRLRHSLVRRCPAHAPTAHARLASVYYLTCDVKLDAGHTAGACALSNTAHVTDMRDTNKSQYCSMRKIDMWMGG